ncbi:MAG: NUDIX hydrolase [Lachnospiraceae bacterium]|jgi:8-oxo-dGTP diphosphatase|nr:NUDIX hydrolase [Lachnospiraceae bacterium]
MKGKNAQGLTEQEFLGRYDPQKYEHPSVTVDVLIFTVDKSREADSLRILLDRREEHPFLHKWALPGSFVGMGESVEQAAARELEEATGLRTPYLEQLYTWGDLGRDPRTRIISVSYIALVPGETLLPEGEKGMPRGEWYNVSARGGQLRLWNGAGELTEADLAFDHAAMIRLALERMKNKLFYTDIAFHLLPEYFTLPELQRLYEAILGESLHSPNFRRDMQKWVERTERKSRPPKAGKPAWYYRQKKERTGNLE